MDAVVAAKLAHHKPLCAQEGWTTKVCAADVYGFLHPVTIPVFQALAKRVAARKFLGDTKLDQKAVWAAVSAAVVSRAASQLLRHAASEDADEDEEIALGVENPVPGFPSISPIAHQAVMEVDALGAVSEAPDPQVEEHAGVDGMKEAETKDPLNSMGWVPLLTLRWERPRLKMKREFMTQ